MPSKKWKKKNKGRKGKGSGSSTPQSSTPSVEDEKQQLLKGGACGSSSGHESRSPTKTKGDGRRTATGKRSPYQSPGVPSSRNAPQSDLLSETDLLNAPGQVCSACGSKIPTRSDTKTKGDGRTTTGKQPHQSPGVTSSKNVPQSDVSSETDLIVADQESGACGLIPPRSATKTKGDGRTTTGKQPQSPGVTSLKNAPQSDLSSETDLLIAQDQESGSKSPSKRSPLSRIRKKIFPPKKSPNRSSDGKCHCEDKTNHQPDCPEMESLAAGAKGKHLECKRTKIRASESKQPSTNTSPNVSSKSKSGTQSSSSSDPSFAEHFRKATELEPTSKKNLKTVTDGKKAIGSSSPLKLFNQVKDAYKKAMTPKRSDTEGSYEELTDQEFGGPGQGTPETGASSKILKGKSPNRNQAKAGASSSKGSSIPKKNKHIASHLSSENSSLSDSKSSSNSDKGNPSSSNISSRKPKSKMAPSRNLSSYDPQEGTSRGPARFEHNRENLGNEDIHNRLSRQCASTLMGGETIGADAILKIEHPNEDNSDEEGKPASDRLIPRYRSKSLNPYRRQVPRLDTNRRSSPAPHDTAYLNVPTYEWNWFDGVREKKDPSPAERNTERDTSKDLPDEIEQELIEAASNMQAPSVRRHVSISPTPIREICDCGAGRSNILGDHDIGCRLFNELRRRRKMRKCRQDVFKRS